MKIVNCLSYHAAQLLLQRPSEKGTVELLVFIFHILVVSNYDLGSQPPDLTGIMRVSSVLSGKCRDTASE
jgi:hypothetical protein